MDIRVSFNMGRLPDPRRLMVAYPAVGLAVLGVGLAARAVQPALVQPRLNSQPLPARPTFLSPEERMPPPPVQAPPLPALAVQGAEAVSPEPESAAPELDEATPAAPAETFKLPAMRMGAKRNSPVAVKLLQKMLKEQGFGALLTDPHSKKDGVDGQFGPKTKKALIELQKKHNLAPTGEVDLATIKLLDKIHPIPKMAEERSELGQNPPQQDWQPHKMMPPHFPERGGAYPSPHQNMPNVPDYEPEDPACDVACDGPEEVAPQAAQPARPQVIRQRRPRGPGGP